MVEQKTFREDLYYRLNVVRIETPALRDRMEDIPELVNFMLIRLDKKFSTGTKEISKDALDMLMTYPWPGNVRELENALHSASVVSKGKRILAKDLPSNLSVSPQSVTQTHSTSESTTKTESKTEASHGLSVLPRLKQKNLRKKISL